MVRRDGRGSDAHALAWYLGAGHGYSWDGSLGARSFSLGDRADGGRHSVGLSHSLNGLTTCHRQGPGCGDGRGSVSHGTGRGERNRGRS